MTTMTFRKSPLFRFIALTVLTAFAGMLPAQPSYAQVAIIMPPPGQMIHITNHFEPPQMVGLTIDLKDPFSFNFIMDQGQDPMSDDVKKEEFNKIIKYFLVSLAMPNKDMWVNLSPYESQRIIPQIFAQTEMGRDLLAQDYILKQFTASLMYPENGLGKTFWDRVYSEAQARFGTTEINVNTFNKVWIVADHADVYQKNNTAFLVGSHLKVMLEQDYMAVEKNKEMFGSVQAVNPDQAMDAKTKMASDLVRQIIIPAIEKEVNEGQSFAAVRQVYNAEIMATWFKKTLKDSLLGQVFANKSKIAGQRVSDPQAMEKIYKQYLRAYKKGVFNYIREDATPEGQTIPRKYFSGGLEPLRDVTVVNAQVAMNSPAVRQEVERSEASMTSEASKKSLFYVTTSLVAGGLAFVASQGQVQGAEKGSYYLNHQAPTEHAAKAPKATANVGVQKITHGQHGALDLQNGTSWGVYEDGSHVGTLGNAANDTSYLHNNVTGVNYFYNISGKNLGKWTEQNHPDHSYTVYINDQTRLIGFTPKSVSVRAPVATTHAPVVPVNIATHNMQSTTNVAHVRLDQTMERLGWELMKAGTWKKDGVTIHTGVFGDLQGNTRIVYDAAKLAAGPTIEATVPLVVVGEGGAYVVLKGGEYTADGAKYTWKKMEQGGHWIDKEGKIAYLDVRKDGGIVLRHEGHAIQNGGIATFDLFKSIVDLSGANWKTTHDRYEALLARYNAQTVQVGKLTGLVQDLMKQAGQPNSNPEAMAKAHKDLSDAQEQLRTQGEELGKLKDAQDLLSKAFVKASNDLDSARHTVFILNGKIKIAESNAKLSAEEKDKLVGDLTVQRAAAEALQKQHTTDTNTIFDLQKKQKASDEQLKKVNTANSALTLANHNLTTENDNLTKVNKQLKDAKDNLAAWLAGTAIVAGTLLGLGALWAWTRNKKQKELEDQVTAATEEARKQKIIAIEAGTKFGVAKNNFDTETGKLNQANSDLQAANAELQSRLAEAQREANGAQREAFSAQQTAAGKAADAEAALKTERTLRENAERANAALQQALKFARELAVMPAPEAQAKLQEINIQIEHLNVFISTNQENMNTQTDTGVLAKWETDLKNLKNELAALQQQQADLTARINELAARNQTAANLAPALASAPAAPAVIPITNSSPTSSYQDILNAKKAGLQAQIRNIENIPDQTMPDLNNPDKSIQEKDWFAGRARVAAQEGVGLDQVKDQENAATHKRVETEAFYVSREREAAGGAFNHQQAVADAIAKKVAELQAEIANLDEYDGHLQGMTALAQEAKAAAASRQEKINTELPNITNQLKDVRETSNTPDFGQQKRILASEMQKISGSTRDFSSDVDREFTKADVGVLGDVARAQSFAALNENLARIALDEKYSAGRETEQRLKSQLEAAQRLKEQMEQRSAAVADVAKRSEVGGINLSDENLTINIKVDGAGMPLPAQFQDSAMKNINGLTSIIRKITPMTPESLPAMYALAQ